MELMYLEEKTVHPLLVHKKNAHEWINALFMDTCKQS